MMAGDELSMPGSRVLGLESNQELTNVSCIGRRNRKGRERGKECGIFHRGSIRDWELHGAGKFSSPKYHRHWHYIHVSVS